MRKISLGLIAAGFLALAVSESKAESIWRISDLGRQQQIYEFIQDWVWARIDFGVWPVASGHSTGSVWTEDGWTHVNWSTGNWCNNQTGPYNCDEHWLTMLTGASGNSNPQNTYFWYALYVDNSSSQRFWDNNGGWNYQIDVNGNGHIDAFNDCSGSSNCN